MTGAPLHGVRVLDLSRLLPGGFCTLVLAELGADVVKVEQPPDGDGVRTTPPFAPTGESAAHLALSRGKRSAALDLRSSVGRDAFLALVAGADVVVESFRPGVLDRLRLGADALAAANPRLVHVSITGYGATGPYAARATHDIDALAVAGVLALTGPPGGGPVPPGFQAADVAAALHAAVAVLAALRRRDTTGEGARLDVSLLDAARGLGVLPAASYAVSGVVPGTGEDPLGGGLACYGTYRCADGRWLAVGALEPKFFARLCELLGVPEMAAHQHDLARQEELRGLLAGVFAQRPRDAWTAVLGDEDVCVAAVLDPAEAAADPQVRARGLVEEVDLGEGTTVLRPRVAPWAAQLGGTPAARVPAVGEDTAAVLAEAGWVCGAQDGR